MLCCKVREYGRLLHDNFLYQLSFRLHFTDSSDEIIRKSNHQTYNKNKLFLRGGCSHNYRRLYPLSSCPRVQEEPN